MEDLSVNTDLQGHIDGHIYAVKVKANELLQPTDWYLVRKVETGIEVPADVLSYRTEVRQYAEMLEAQYGACMALEAVFELREQENWPGTD